jgi:hypothetical protein
MYARRAPPCVCLCVFVVVVVGWIGGGGRDARRKLLVGGSVAVESSSTSHINHPTTHPPTHHPSLTIHNAPTNQTKPKEEKKAKQTKPNQTKPNKTKNLYKNAPTWVKVALVSWTHASFSSLDHCVAMVSSDLRTASSFSFTSPSHCHVRVCYVSWGGLVGWLVVGWFGLASPSRPPPARARVCVYVLCVCVCVCVCVLCAFVVDGVGWVAPTAVRACGCGGCGGG